MTETDAAGWIFGALLSLSRRYASRMVELGYHSAMVRNALLLIVRFAMNRRVIFSTRGIWTDDRPTGSGIISIVGNYCTIKSFGIIRCLARSEPQDKLRLPFPARIEHKYPLSRLGSRDNKVEK